MKLVELLARKLGEWPDGVKYYAQNGGSSSIEGWRSFPEYDGSYWYAEEFAGRVETLCGYKLATDRATAIITREMWEAEKARIGKQEEKEMTPCEELGYKVGDEFVLDRCVSGAEKGQVITLFMDDGTDHPLFKADPCEYDNADGLPGDYFLLEWVSKVTPVTAQQQFGKHLEWRDRITQIDNNMLSMKDERAELVAKLAAVGLAVIEVVVNSTNPVEDI